MKYKNILVPFTGDSEIKQKADALRRKLWGDKIPVGVEEIIEIKLKIKIIPIPNLFELCSVDSQISSDFLSIIVDQVSYENNESNRIYFSLAHELGHYILHKDLFSSFKIESVEDIMAFINNISEKQYFFLETQANKFASQFLMPREILSDARRNIIEAYKLGSMDKKLVNSYIADGIAKKFNVSSFAAELALNDLSR